MPEKPRFRCPNCGGAGRMSDGSITIYADPKRTWDSIRPATKCWVCDGSGYVYCTPAVPAGAGEKRE